MAENSTAASCSKNPSMSFDMSRDYPPAEIYTAPLTQSAIAKQGPAIHQRFVRHLEDYIAFVVERRTSSPGHKDFDRQYLNIDSKFISGNVRPDGVYDDGDVRIIGEVKVNLRDLRDSHTVQQLSAYVQDLLSDGNSSKEKIIIVMTPFNIGGVARHVVEEVKDRFGEGEIKDIEFLFASEIDNHSIAAPKGWEDIDFDREIPTEVTSKHYGIIPVIEKWVSIDKLKFDGNNSRLIGIADNSGITQAEAFKRLLSDGDCANTDDAISRRGQITSGSIKEPLWVTSDGTVHDGNSRLAYARHIFAITNGQAPGYSRVKILVFPEDIDSSVLDDLKQEKQAATVLDHGRIHDAIDMWRRVEKASQTPEYVAESVYAGKYAVELVKQSVAAVDWLTKNGYGTDELVDKMYYTCYALMGVNWTSHGKKWDRHGITMNTVMRAACDAVDGDWLKGRNISALVPVLNDTAAPDWKIEAVNSFINQDEGWSGYSEWVASYNKAKEKNNARIGAGKAIKSLRTSTTYIEQVSDALSGIRAVLNSVSNGTYEGENWKSEVFSQKQFGELSMQVAEINELTDKLKDDLLRVQGEYYGAIAADKKVAKTARKASKKKAVA